MENEILEYIDDVRSEYPEVVAEDEPIIITSYPDFEESYIYQEPEKSVLAISENNIENINELKSMGVLDNESKSDVLIRSSNAVNNNRSAKILDINNPDDFDLYVLWENSNPSASYSGGFFASGIDFSGYDFIGLYYRPLNSSTVEGRLFFYGGDVLNGNVGGGIRGGSYTRPFIINYEREGICHCSQAIDYVTVNNNYCIPVRIIGLNFKEEEHLDIPEVNPSVSGNVININNYFCSVSDNSVSNNIMTKNLNDYSVGESLSLMIFLGLLVAGMVYTIKKSIFKW